jgi:RNA polymerase sigma-70 factor (ECF subfamily)
MGRGDADAEIRDFVAAHYDRLIRLAALVLRAADEAEDAVQAALERAWRDRAKLRDPSRLQPWLDRIVVREAIRGRQHRLPVVNPPFDLATTDAADRSAAVRVALGALTPVQRAVVVLHLHRGYSVAQTAEILKVPEETVRSRLRVARDRLRYLLAEKG